MRFLGLAALFIAGQTFAASPLDASNYIRDLDVATKAAEPILKSGDQKAIHEQSKRMSRLKEDGKKFGTSVFDRPFGRCFAAGVHAQSWWLAKLYVTQTGKESSPGVVAGAWKEYLAQRGECLKVSKAGDGALATEQVASTSETPPRKGCLKVLGVRPDGSVGTVSYTCPKK
ncbi:hypothetical protein [Chromobacterium haemolyticum]|uniref:hypothetical protein n=1 Tax=Chromobacterium haemolyticum TaxID=394935 RepID=UPI0011B261EE|nr:hypothetical protein [Chromobacterium haemolyticum]